MKRSIKLSIDLAKTSGSSPPVVGSLKIEEDEVLDSKSAAKLLGITVVSLFNLCSQGKVPYYKFGRRNRYLKSELLNLLLATPRGGLR
jgi:hypothetical protein